MTARSIELARAAVSVAKLFDVAFMGLAGTCHQTACEESGVKFIAEWFADLDYSPEGKLLITKYVSKLLRVSPCSARLSTGHTTPFLWTRLKSGYVISMPRAFKHHHHLTLQPIIGQEDLIRRPCDYKDGNCPHRSRCDRC